MKQESASVMSFHGTMIGIVAFVVMRYVLNMDFESAETKSIALMSFSTLYMIMFGHKLPGDINPQLLK